MQFEHNGTTYSFPVLLSEITLGSRIAFYEQYGKELDTRAKSIAAIPDPLERELEMEVLGIDTAVQTFSHYTGMPIDVVTYNVPLVQLMAIYNTDMALLAEQEANIQLQPQYSWKEEVWKLSPPELKPGSEMTLNEFIYAKEVVRQLDAIGRGQWDALPYLCAIYMRKDGEAFAESMVSEGSGRMAEMLELPLDMALSVAFFLSSTMRIYLPTSPYSKRVKAAVSTQQATSTGGAGKLS